MRNIKNLKDPTQWLRFSLLLIYSHYFCVNAQNYNWLSGNGMRISQNVTCIAHDAQFTCDCQNQQQQMLLPALFGDVYLVEVRNCKALTVEANALAETLNIQRIRFKNVDKLVLNKYALAVPLYASNTPLIVEFEAVNFELIDSHAIKGNIGEMAFIGGSIKVIQPFGFTTMKERAILLKMDGVRVERIEQQAFKKFVVEQMEIINCQFVHNVPTRAFYDLEVLHALSMRNNKFQLVHSQAFSFKLISKLNIEANRFAGIDGEWLEAYIRDSIVIRENHFGNTSDIAFRAIRVHRDYQLSERMELRFINNTVRIQMQGTTQEPLALTFNGRFALNLKQLQYDNAWNCAAVDQTIQPMALPKSIFFRLHSDNIYFKRGNMYDADINADVDPNVNVAIERTQTANSQGYVVLSKIIEWDCQQRSYMAFIVIGIIILVLLLLFVILSIWCYMANKRKRRKMDVVQPEPRTYKETQIIYQIENAGLLKTDM